jgi:cohesin complex subunit SA-1/2
VRHEAVNSLSCVYAQVDYLSSLNHFTERFKPRMLEMAKGDTDIGIRVAMVKVLSAIDAQSMLEDEEREQLCLLVFDQETRVRRAVAGFLRSMWIDTVDERLVGTKASGKDKQRVGIKALGTVLVRLGKALDKIAHGDDIAEDDNDADAEDGPSGSGLGSSRDGQAYRLPSAVSAGLQDRISHAVEALWEQFEPVGDWATLLDVLQLDHSASDDAEGGSQATAVNAMWRLTDAEEDVLLEVLVATFRRSVLQTVVSSKKVFWKCYLHYHEHTSDLCFRLTTILQPQLSLVR